MFGSENHRQCYLLCLWKLESRANVLWQICLLLPPTQSHIKPKTWKRAPGERAQLLACAVGSIPGKAFALLGSSYIFIILIFWKHVTSRGKPAPRPQALSGVDFTPWAVEAQDWDMPRSIWSQDLGQALERRWWALRSSFSGDITFCHLTMCLLLCFTQICWGNLSTVIIFSNVWPNGYKF